MALPAPIQGGLNWLGQAANSAGQFIDQSLTKPLGSPYNPSTKPLNSIGNFAESALPFGIGNTLNTIHKMENNPIKDQQNQAMYDVMQKHNINNNPYSMAKFTGAPASPGEDKQIVTQLKKQGLSDDEINTLRAGGNNTPTVSFAGEMENVSGVNPEDFSAGTSLIKDEKGNFHVNPNPQPAQYAQDTTAVDNTAVQPPSKVNPQQTNENPWPEVPSKPTASTVDKGFKLPGSYDPIDKISASGASSNSKAYSVTTPEIQEAYRRNGITDPNQVYLAKQALYDQKINPALQTDNTRLPLGEMGKSDGIIPRIVKEIQNMDPSLDDTNAYNAAGTMVNKLNGLAQSENANTMTPSSIGLKNLMDYKTTLNQSNAVKNMLNGQLPTSPQDIATVATRNVLSGLLTKYAPSDITQAVKDYGLLEEGFPSYLKAAQNPGAPFSLTNTVLGNELGKFVPPVAKVPIDLAARGAVKTLESPVGRGIALGGGLATAGIFGLPALYKALTNKSESQAQNDKGSLLDQPPHSGTIPQSTIKSTADIPQSIQNITPDASGNYAVGNPYEITGSDGNSLALSPEEYQTQQSQIDQQKKDPRYAYLPSFKAAVDAQQEALQTKESNSKPLGQAYQLATNLNAKAMDARQIMQSAPPQLWQGIKSLDDLRKSTNPTYRRLVSDLDFLDKAYPSANLVGVQTPEVATQALDQVNKQFLNDYYQGLLQFTGNTSSGVSQLPAATQTGLSPVASQPSGLPPTGGNANSIVGGNPPSYQYSNGQWQQQ